MPGMCAYVSSKSFVTMMSITLSYECQDKLDVLSFNPGVVATPMTTNTAGEAGATSAEESVAACLRDLGHGDRMTLGMACHDNDLISITNTDPAQVYKNVVARRGTVNQPWSKKEIARGMDKKQ